MTRVVISPTNVAGFPEGGGHYWVYMQYALGLWELGCEVYWLERMSSFRDADHRRRVLETFFARMRDSGLGGRAFLHDLADGNSGRVLVGPDGSRDERTPDVLDRLAAGADLLLNFDYAVDRTVLERFARTALVDIDPGQLQYWIQNGQLRVHPHDQYYTIGETVGTPAARFPDCGVRWIYVRPPVCLTQWPFTYDAACEAFTTVSGWWSRDWFTDGSSLSFGNTKRKSFMRFVDLPRLTHQPLELALNLAPGDERDRGLLEFNGWRVRHAYDVSATPARYRRYVQGSRGEFSCVKPSCILLQNAWISDRSLCYLASGKPIVVQDTGPSAFLPHGTGLFRVSIPEQAAEAFARINADYRRHCIAAREIAETYFDARRVVAGILETSLA
jgi:hypothetical protein